MVVEHLHRIQLLLHFVSYESSILEKTRTMEIVDRNEYKLKKFQSSIKKFLRIKFFSSNTEGDFFERFDELWCNSDDIVIVSRKQRFFELVKFCYKL